MYPTGLRGLAEHRYVLLTTFRRDGTPVATTVWLVPDADTVLVITGARTGKAERLRHTPRLLLAPCDARGVRRAGDPDIVAIGELLTSAADVRRVRAMIRSRYGLRYDLRTAALRARGGRGAEVGIRIRDAGTST